MRYQFIFISIVFSFLFFKSTTDVYAVVSTSENETRDVVGSYGAINDESPYFPHETVPHDRYGTVPTTNVDLYPGDGSGDYRYLESFDIEMHDHDEGGDADIWVHTQSGGWTMIRENYDVGTTGGDARCGERSSIYGLNNHPHNDSPCYASNRIAVNQVVDQVLLKFHCHPNTKKCPLNPDMHYHIRNITWNLGSCRYQGYKFLNDSIAHDSLIAGQPVSLNGSVQTDDQPYFIHVPAGTTNTISVPDLANYNVSSTTCENSIDCHDDPAVRTNGSSKTVLCPLTPIGGGPYVDLWWHYESAITPTPTPTAVPPTPTPTGVPSTPTPTDAPDAPTPTPTLPPAACFELCPVAGAEKDGLKCLDTGVATSDYRWRNENCLEDTDCNCSSPTPTPTTAPSSTTGLWCPI